MSGPVRWDVVIVGARVSGASTALLLARAGLRVLVVDRARRGSDTLSTHALMRGGVVQLNRWGLLDRLVAAGTPAIHRTTFHIGGETVPVTIKPFAGVDALYAPRRTVLDLLLSDAAVGAGAVIRFATTLVDLVRDRSGRVAGVVLADDTGRRYVERAGVVVGADGRSSVVADLAAAATTYVGRHHAAYSYGYWAGLPFEGYHWFYGRPQFGGLTAGLIPTNDGEACVFVGAAEDVMAAAPRSGSIPTLLGHLDPYLAELVQTAPTGTIRRFRGAPARLRQAFGPGWALVGDAGWWKDPLATHGITDALRDAELLARAIVAQMDGDARAMSEYEGTRDAVALTMRDVIDRLASHAWDLDEAQALLRTLSSVMAAGVEVLLRLDEVPVGGGALSGGS
jgi:2-polyprenyl-6-methoxyphenol hydroxylase-like FAD-dependent oxidoreductase